MDRVIKIIDFLKAETAKSQILTKAIIEFAESLKREYDSNYFRITKVEKLVMPNLSGIEIIDERLKIEGINDGDSLINKIIDGKFYPKFYSNKDVPENKRIFFGETGIGYIITEKTKKIILYLLKYGEKTGFGIESLIEKLESNFNITLIECQETVQNTSDLNLEHSGFKRLKEILVHHYFTISLSKHGEFRNFCHNRIFSSAGEGYEIKEEKIHGCHNTSCIKKHFTKFPIAFKILQAEGLLDFIEDDKYN